MFAMETVYLGSAALGALVLAGLTVLGLFGGDADADIDMDASLDSVEDAGGLSARTLAAFFLFFGLAGMAALGAGFGPWASGGCAFAAGSLAFWIVGLIMLQFQRFQSSGTVNIQNTVGQEARVYLKIPGQKQGEGKVTVAVQGRTVEYRAITAGPELASGEYCRIVGVLGPTSVVVETLGPG